MKTKLLLLSLILLTGCYDKENIRKYSTIRNHYDVILPLIKFVIQDQDQVAIDEMVGNYDADEPIYVRATFDDKF